MDGWKSPGGVKYRAAYAANKNHDKDSHFYISILAAFKAKSVTGLFAGEIKVALERYLMRR